MKNRYILLLIAFVACLSSCNSYFDLDGEDVTAKLVVYCMPAAGRDTTVIQLSKSLPVSSSGLPPTGIPGADVEFLVNGEPKTVQWTDRKIGCVPRECYYVVAPLHEGDEVEVKAAYGSLEPVSAHTLIPSVFHLESVRMQYKPALYEQMQIQVAFSDDGNTDDYYGVRVEMCKISRSGIGTDDKWVYDEKVEYMTIPEIDLSEEPLLNNKVGLDATFDFDYYYYDNIYIWTDEMIGGKDYTLKLNTPYCGGWESSHSKVYYLYQLTLYRLSPEFYKYLKSVNDINSNELGQNGLAPIRSHYSNVENGFGVVGGCQILKTAWIESPTKKEPVVWKP